MKISIKRCRRRGGRCGKVENMENENITRYFLGANSRYGFYSLYDGFVDLAGGDFLWVIKGGPGCGKSSFMKRIGSAAEDAGFPVEYIHCSGDPNSLDGVWLPTLRTGYADGTAPHVIEAAFPGAASLYLDLGTFYDAGALERELDGVLELNRRYKALYKRAYGCISAAAEVSPKSLPGLWGAPEREKILRKLTGMASREFHGVSGAGGVKKRFLSAVSCKGRVFMRETLDRLCQRVCTLDNELGMAHFYLSGIADLAQENALSVVLCPDPLDPELLEAVLLPELSLGFLAVDSQLKYSGEVYRHLRLDTIAERETLTSMRSQLRHAKKLSSELLDTGMETLAEAKRLHDELESIYNPHVDFEGLYATAQEHIDWLLGED